MSEAGELVQHGGAETEPEQKNDFFDLTLIGLLWIAVFSVAGLFLVDVIGAMETEPDECYAYAYGSGPGGYGCNPLLGDAYFEADQTDDLVDKQTVHINGFLFDANQQFGIVQCSGVAFVLEETPSGVDACDLSNVALGSTDANGELSTDIVVRRIITTPNSGDVDCALPDANCVIAGGVLGSDLYSTTEAAYVAISFDPDVPPVPAPTVSLEVTNVDADSMTLSVHCPNATNISLDAQFEQQIDDQYGSAYGYFYDNDAPACADGPTDYEIALQSGDRRIGKGDVTYYAYAYASDGDEYAYANVQGEFNLRRTPRPTYITDKQPGTELDIELLGLTGSGTNQHVNLAVTCGRTSEYGSVYFTVSQWSGLDRIYGNGQVDISGCEGRLELSIPITASNGRLQGGTAQLDVSVYAQDYTSPDDYYFDQARLQEQVRLRGVLTAELPQYPNNPDSRITIDQITRDGVSGHVECDGDEILDISAQAYQYDRRLIRSFYAYLESGTIECDGVTEFDLVWNTRLQKATTSVNINASGYNLVDFTPPDYPVTYPTVVPTTTTDRPGAAFGAEPFASPPSFEAFGTAVPGRSLAGTEADHGYYYEFLWSDYQSETGRVRR